MEDSILGNDWQEPGQLVEMQEKRFGKWMKRHGRSKFELWRMLPGLETATTRI